MAPYKCEGIDYTKDGILALRVELIAMRKDAMRQWPEGITATVVLTHAIALLAYLAELVE